MMAHAAAVALLVFLTSDGFALMTSSLVVPDKSHDRPSADVGENMTLLDMNSDLRLTGNYLKAEQSNVI